MTESKRIIDAPIRILHAVTFMGRGGIETMLMNYYRHIDRSKVQFDFLVHRDFRADYDDEIESLGGKIYRLPRLVPWSIKYKKALRAFFQEHPEYKIIHAHINCMSAVILKAAKKANVAVRIAHSHTSTPTKRLAYPMVLFYRRQLPKYANEYVACGKEAGDWMFDGAPYMIINNAIDTVRYAFTPEIRQRIRNELRISEESFVIGHVGRISAEKNHAYLLDVFCEIKKQRLDAKLLLVGDGPLRKEIENKAKEMGIYDSIIFTGVRSDVPDLMQAMDCFVFPSLIEGLPVALIEAQAAGLPCVISDGVSAEAVKTDVVDRIPLSEGVSAWAQHILKSVGKQRTDTRQEIIRAGYDVKTNAENLQNFYLDHWKKDI